jgi:predicted transcriptional regulator of viral defense system
MVTFKELLARQAVITLNELREALDQDHSRHPRSREALLSYHLKVGHLARARRGLYIVVPLGADPATCPVDPLVLAGKWTDTAVLAYRTALEAYGRLPGQAGHYFFQSRSPAGRSRLRGWCFESVVFPKSLRESSSERLAVTTVTRSGMEIAVTSLERTLVDLLDRPAFSGGWWNAWRLAEAIPQVNPDLVVEYVRRLGNRTTAAKVGCYLERHATSLPVPEGHLESLRQLVPRQPHYVERDHEGSLASAWNLILPDDTIPA